jgi:Ni,Fe-hydrogenase maturation factor
MRKARRPIVYCFGNPLLKEDSLPFLLIPQLREEFPEIDFVEANSPDDIEERDEILILDTAKGITKATVLSDIDALCSNRTCSLHDFDLGMTLKLMQKMGKLKKVRIFCIPMGYSKAKAFAELKKLIKAKME